MANKIRTEPKVSKIRIGPKVNRIKAEPKISKIRLETFYFLLEDNTYLLQEDGYKLMH